MRTAHTATAINIAKATNLSAFMIATFLQQQRRTTNLTIQANGMEQGARRGLKEVHRSGLGSGAAHSCRHGGRLRWDARGAGGLSLRMLVLYDDADHEFDYVTRAESAPRSRSEMLDRRQHP
jgi:hypothetical protein